MLKKKKKIKLSHKKTVAVTLELVVFFHWGENPKTWSVRWKRRGSSGGGGGNTFISVEFSSLSTSSVISTVVNADTFHGIIPNRQLFRNTKNPCTRFEGNASLESVFLPGFLVSITAQLVFPPKLLCSSLR